MFAGIIEKKARILAAEKERGMLRVRIGKPSGWRFSLGQSISVDGICSTVVKSGTSAFTVEYMPTTLSKTTAADFQKGRIVNLERSLVYGMRIEGHPVQGHVDSAARVSSITRRGASKKLAVTLGAAFARRVALHSSVAINGVSLTVAKKHGPHITVALIPHTLRATNLDALGKGDAVNVELDHTSAYLARMRKK
jgi:riboflavin synthase